MSKCGRPLYKCYRPRPWCEGSATAIEQRTASAGAGSQLLGSGDVLRCLHRIDITAHEYDGIKPVLPNGLRLDRKARIANNRAARLREHMQNIWSMASCCCHLIESRKWPSKIKSIVATANEKSNSMRHEVVNRQHLE
jgi:hypothetical protein